MDFTRVEKLILDLPSSYGIKGRFFQACRHHVMDEVLKRDKPMSDDHIKQVAVKWAKEHMKTMQEYWKEWNRPFTAEEYHEAERIRIEQITKDVMLYA